MGSRPPRQAKEEEQPSPQPSTMSMLFPRRVLWIVSDPCMCFCSFLQVLFCTCYYEVFAGAFATCTHSIRFCGVQACHKHQHHKHSLPTLKHYSLASSR